LSRSSKRAAATEKTTPDIIPGALAARGRSQPPSASPIWSIEPSGLRTAKEIQHSLCVLGNPARDWLTVPRGQDEEMQVISTEYR
jgi:hypothetical protein